MKHGRAADPEGVDVALDIPEARVFHAASRSAVNVESAGTLVLGGSEVGECTVQRLGGGATEDPKAITGHEHRSPNGAVDPVYSAACWHCDWAGYGGAGQRAEGDIGSRKCGATECQVRDRASGLEIRKQHDRAAEQLEAGNLVMQLQRAAGEGG